MRKFHEELFGDLLHIDFEFPLLVLKNGRQKALVLLSMVRLEASAEAAKVLRIHPRSELDEVALTPAIDAPSEAGHEETDLYANPVPYTTTSTTETPRARPGRSFAQRQPLPSLAIFGRQHGEESPRSVQEPPQAPAQTATLPQKEPPPVHMQPPNVNPFHWASNLFDDLNGAAAVMRDDREQLFHLLPAPLLERKVVV